GFVFHEVLLHELRDALRRHAVIPGPFRIHKHGRPVAADAQAADFGAVAGVGTGAEVAILDLRLESFPSGLADFRRAAVRAGAKEDVPLIAADADLGGRGPQLFVYFGHGDAPVFSVILSSVTRSRMVRRYLWIIAGRGVSNGLLSQTFRRFRDKFRRMLRRLLRT